MSFVFTEDQLMVQKLAREIAQNSFKPLAQELDQTGRFPKENMQLLVDAGLMGLNVPEEYGGSAMDEVCKVLAIEEVAKGCASTAEFFAVHLLVNNIINTNGNEEQKQKYLTMACEGKLGAFALTEPNAGSDAAGVKTKAVRDGDDYIINGTKCFISNMGPDEGDYVVVIVLTDPEKKTRGMTAFLIDRDSLGFSVGKTENKMGMTAASVSEIIFDNCRVPASAMLGKEGEGFKIAMSGLDSGRVGIAAQACGVAEGALEAAIEYSSQRIQFGKPINANQGIQWYLADMATKLEASKLLTLNAANARDTGNPDASKYCSMAKYYAAESAIWIVHKALQIHGGYGYMKEYDIERMYRDVRIIALYEGTSEVQKMVISKALLK